MTRRRQSAGAAAASLNTHSKHRHRHRHGTLACSPMAYTWSCTLEGWLPPSPPSRRANLGRGPSIRMPSRLLQPAHFAFPFPSQRRPTYTMHVARLFLPMPLMTEFVVGALWPRHARHHDGTPCNASHAMPCRACLCAHQPGECWRSPHASSGHSRVVVDLVGSGVEGGHVLGHKVVWVSLGACMCGHAGMWACEGSAWLRQPKQRTQVARAGACVPSLDSWWRQAAHQAARQMHSAPH